MKLVTSKIVRIRGCSRSIDIKIDNVTVSGTDDAINSSFTFYKSKYKCTAHSIDLKLSVYPNTIFDSLL